MTCQGERRIKNFLIWKLFAIYNHWCRWRLLAALPGVRQEIAEYGKASYTTSTKFPTLWRTVQLILRHKPAIILKAGTGLSTIVLAAAFQQLRAHDQGYFDRIVSMESVGVWYEMAKRNLPLKYQDVVELFRGYRHSNIPALDSDFVFLDALSYEDENSGFFCEDVFHVVEASAAPVVRGIIDTRVSSVFVEQQVSGRRAVRYYPIMRTSDFRVSKRPFRTKISSRDFHSNLLGEVSLILTSPSKPAVPR